ncbi:MAG TPA: hypothetical protein DEQ88_04555 [Clostridiales bacterium]|nr:hypothetical protein [Clostridiales bacterium]
MTEKQIKKRLELEMDKNAPKKTAAAKTSGAANSGKKKTFISIIAGACVLALVIGIVAIVMNNNKDKDQVSYVAVDINPSVEFLVDKDGKVVTVIPENEDAQILLSGEELEGLTFEAAIDKVGKLAVECGYLKDENNKVTVTVSGNAELSASLYDVAKAAIETAGKTVGAVVSEGTNYLLEKEVVYLKSNNQGKEGYDTLTAGKLRLIKTAMLADRTLTMDDAVKMSEEDLVKRVNEHKEYLKGKVETSLAIATEGATTLYEVSKQAYLDTAYVSVASQSIKSDPVGGGAKTYNAAKYLALNATYGILTGVSDMLDIYKANPVITEDDVLNLLNFVDADADEEAVAVVNEIKAAYGECTLDNIQKYIKSLAYDEEGNARKLEIAFQIYTGTEENNQILAAKMALSADGFDLSGILGPISKYIKIGGEEGSFGEMVDSLFSALGVKVSEIKDQATLENAITAVKDARDKALADCAFSDEELKAVEEKQASYADKIASFEQTMNDAIASAKASFEKMIEESKKTRIEATGSITIG